MTLESFKDPKSALREMSERLKKEIETRESKNFSIALSGGETAKEMFKIWAEEFDKTINWACVNFFWVDERCVAPNSDESNFKFANELFFKHLNIKPENIFRIKGEENDPEAEAMHYGELTKKLTNSQNGHPHFDCLILGMGSDGHCASIFPNNLPLLIDSKSYAVSEHPKTKQKRIGITGTAILATSEIYLPILGKNKRAILDMVLDESETAIITLPTSYIVYNADKLTIFTDAL